MGDIDHVKSEKERKEEETRVDDECVRVRVRECVIKEETSFVLVRSLRLDQLALVTHIPFNYYQPTLILAPYTDE